MCLQGPAEQAPEEVEVDWLLIEEIYSLKVSDQSEATGPRWHLMMIELPIQLVALEMLAIKVIPRRL